MTKDKWLGLGFLIGGAIYLWWVIKHPIKNDTLTGNIKGIIAGVGSIIIGIMLLTGKGHW
jgi:hypothetical protein